MSTPILITLLEKFRAGALTGAERQELAALLDDPSGRAGCARILEDALADPALPLTGDSETMELIYRQIVSHPEFTRETLAPIVPLRPDTRRIPWKKWPAAAASLLILLAASWWFLFRHRPETMEAAQTQAQRFHNDVAPGHNAAILTLANGQKIILDSAENGRLAQQPGALVIKSDSSSLTYRAEVRVDGQPQTWNTLTTPRGGQYKLTLPDGSRVWLDASSSITYPTTFSGPERQVAITGQAYLEVVHNPKRPFRVRAGNTLIEDIGTRFNINAYTDEPAITTTLLAGAVKISTAHDQDILTPGQQAISTQTGAIRTTGNTDLAEATAWKDGQFRFTQTDMQTIMRQIARWYDADIVFEDPVPGHFVADIPRDEPISRLLQLLELTGRVHFKIEGKKITVMR